MIFKPCHDREILSTGGMRAIVPSSFMISQITPAGYKPGACAAISTAASVCVRDAPATPPVFARCGEYVARTRQIERPGARIRPP
jgi:hypothetical protein